MRKARVVTNPEDIKYLLELTEERCLEKSFITEAFGEYNNGNYACAIMPMWYMSRFIN